MWLNIPEILTKDEVAQVRDILSKVEYKPQQRYRNRLTRDEFHKNNLQIPLGHPDVKPAATLIGSRLMENRQFNIFAWPKHVNMLFNRYELGMKYERHCDNGLLDPAPGRPACRTDLSFTVSLSEPDEYEGGDFVAEFYGEERHVRLPAGDAMIYMPDTMHGVEPVESGARWMLVGWIQSYLPDPKEREILYNYCTIMEDTVDLIDNRKLKVRMEQLRDQLLRRWTQV